MAEIGTCLNVDDHASVRVFVGPHSVEMHYARTEIEMDAGSLAVFIATAEQALPRLAPSRRPTRATTANRPPADTLTGLAGDDVPDETGCPRFSEPQSTWMICDADDVVEYTILADMVELHWDDLVWTITTGALSRLLDRARRAQVVLDAHLNQVEPSAAEVDVPDLFP